MSSLSKGNLNEIASLYSGITLNESSEVSEGILSRGLQYAKGTLSPIIKKNLKLDPKKGLAKGLLDKSLQKGVSAASKVARGGYELAKQTAKTAGKQALGTAKFVIPNVALPAAAIGTVADITAPMRGGQSKILNLLKPKYEETYQEGEVLTEEVIQENTSVLVYAIGDYLVENNFAPDSEKAIKIMENMSDKWAEEIIVSYLQIEENVDG